MRPGHARPARRIGTVITATVGTGIIALSGLVAPTPASAAPSDFRYCYAETCRGLDPKHTPCYSDAQTLDHKTHDGATIQLRYSLTCRAVWAREQGGKVHDFLWVRNSSNEQESTHITSGSDAYTLMVNDADITAAACMTLTGQTTYTCTGWH